MGCNNLIDMKAINVGAQRAYNEINEFEKELVDWGAVVIKFWVHIEKDTQLERFNERQNLSLIHIFLQGPLPVSLPV